MDRTNDQAVNSRLLVGRQKMHGSQKCSGELAELADRRYQELRRLAYNSRRGTMELGRSVAKTTVDCHSLL